MTSKEMKNIGQTQIMEKRSIRNGSANNIKSYSLKKITIEKNIKASDIDEDKNSQKSTIQSKASKYKSKSNDKLPIIKSQSQNNSFYISKDIKSYEHISSMDTINLKHHPKQVNNLIHNHKYYNSKTLNAPIELNQIKTSKMVKSKSTERINRVKKINHVDNSKYTVETKRFEYFGKPRNSSASNSSRETNISISKSQLKKLMSNMWLESIYCSNVESLSCLMETNNQRNSNYIAEIHEKEFEKNENIIKEYEAQIIKMKSVLNIKEQEIKRLIQNLKHSENTLKIKNKQIYELNIKKGIKRIVLDKDSHELQIISTKQKLKNENKFEKDSHSLQIISAKKSWNKINVPSPVNEIFIETVKYESALKSKKYEEKRRVMIRKEEEKIYKKKLENISKFEIQEMCLLSIISKKPKKINYCQHLQPLMILSKPKEYPLIFQKIEEIIITSQPNKKGNKIQKLNGLEIINIKKNKEIILQEQCLNGLEIRREYDVLMIKPSWDSLKIQGSGLNLISLKKEIQLENQEIDEFQILGKDKPNLIVEKIKEIKIKGKNKNITDYKINKERIKLLGMPKKEEINWNKINKPIKAYKLLINNEYEKTEPKIEIDWNDIIKPIKTTKLFVKSLRQKENVFRMVKKDKFNFIYSSPNKNIEEYDIENFNINLINSEKKIKQNFKIIKSRFDIKGKEKKKCLLIKNKIDSINIFGLIKKSNLIPSTLSQLEMTSKINPNKEWNLINKIIKIKDVSIRKINKQPNKISKKEVNIEIRTNKKIILKPIKEIKIIIQPLKKNNEISNLLMQKNEYKLFIKGIKKEEKQIINWNDLNKLKNEHSMKLSGNKKEKLNWNDLNKSKKVFSLKLLGNKNEKIDWNNFNKLRKEYSMNLINKNNKKDWNISNKLKRENNIKLKGNIIKKKTWNEFIKIDKKSIVNIIHKPKPLKFKKQNLFNFNLKGIKIKENNKLEIINNIKNSVKPQRSIKLNIKGKIKQIELEISERDKFMIKREPEEEIIFNDDYNYLTQEMRQNGKEKNIKEKEKEKILVIKEKEITPIMRREIRAQVVKIKEDLSETSEQSDVDVLEGIQTRRTIAFSSGRLSSSSGYKKEIIEGKVIFTPKINFGEDRRSFKHRKESYNERGLRLYNNTENEKVSEIELCNRELYNDNLDEFGRTMKERGYKIINADKIGIINSGLNIARYNTIYKAQNNIKTSKKLSQIPNDSKKKNVKKQIIIKSKIKTRNNSVLVNDENININNNKKISNENINNSAGKIIFNTHLPKRYMKHSTSTV